ncbi:MAG TPA: choice-of-anchor Q domain-containing protein [Solimonas sp.]
MGLSLLMPLAAHAATITVGADCTLLNAIQNANDDSATANPFGGDCAAGDGSDTIVLTDNVTLTQALPSVSSDITIQGNGKTIARSSAAGTPDFGILHVSSNGTASVDRVTLSNGKGSQGGAVLVHGSLVLTNSTITGNEATQGSGGGGIYVATGSLSLRNSTVSGNTAPIAGGIRFAGGATLIVNSTITGNSATSAGSNGGGGLLVAGTTTVTVRNSIVSGNTATGVLGKEIQRATGTLILNANNLLGHDGVTQADAFSGDGATPGALDINATSEASAGVLSPTAMGNILNTSLANNGGPTFTHALVANSPAINASGANALSTDQRGFAANGVRDIGAFEFDGISPAPTVTALNPTSGPAAGGTRVTITGTNFGSVTGPFVKFGSADATGVSRLNATTIEATAPAGTGTVNVTVTTDEGTSANNGTLDDYTYISSAPGACNTTTTSTATASAPSMNLCATGTAGAVTSSNGVWNWTCNGTGGNTTNVSCTAPFATQTITLTAEPTSILIGGSSTVFATSTSGLKPDLTRSTTGTCTIAPVAGNPMGSTVSATGTAVGTCTVLANVPVSPNGCTSCYQAAMEKSVAITVNATTPGAPTGLMASPGDGRAVLSFTAPGSNGGAAITNYQYAVDEGEFQAFSPAVTRSPATIFGLSNGTSYQIRLRAINSAGAGASSTPITVTPRADVIPQPPATAPRNVSATAGDGQVTLRFDPVDDASNYQYSLDGGRTYRSFDPAITTSPATISGLDNGTTYRITLRAINADGAGPASAAVTVIPLGNDRDTDGIDTTIEDAVPGANGGTGDGNGDGIADSTQAAVASLPDANGNYSTLVSSGGRALSAVRSVAPPTDFPNDAGSVLAGLSFTVSGLPAGGAETFELYLPSSRGPVTGLRKQNLRTSTWDEIPSTIATVGSKIRIVYSLVDGGDYDADRLANGQISDPVFVVGPTGSSTGGTTGGTTGGNGNGGSGGGSLGLLLLAPLAAMAAIRRRRLH